MPVEGNARKLANNAIKQVKGTQHLYGKGHTQEIQ